MLSLIRHAQPEDRDKVLGQLDPPLHHLTRGNKSRERQFCEDTVVISSPLRRAVKTAELFGYSDPIIDKRVTEMDLGTYQGMQKSGSVLKKINQLDRNPHSNAHQGESLAEFLTRVEDFYTEYKDHDRVVVFTHAGVIRALCCSILNLASRDYSPAYLEMVSFRNTHPDKQQIEKNQIVLSLS